MKNVKLWIKLIVALIILYYFFASIDFTETQSFFLALIVILFYDYLKGKNNIEKIEKEFEPFNIHIQPNWQKLLIDYKVIKENDWEKTSKIIHKTYEKENEYHVLKNGISFSFVKSNLVYNINHNNFSSDVDIREKIEELKEKPNKENGLVMSYTPELYIKRSIEGYDIGITTAESFNKVHLVGDDNELIKIATIPFSEFWAYSGIEMNKKQLEKHNKSLKDNNWEEVNEQVDEILTTFPSHLKNKYFSVYHISI